MAESSVAEARSGSMGLMKYQVENVLQGKQLAFLVGAPRSGTTWLQLLLSRSPSVVTAQETHLFDLFLRSMLDQWDFHRRVGDHVGLNAVLNDEEFHDLLRIASGFVFAKMARSKPSATVVLEKTPNHVNCYREILDLWPDAHFIHIIRDPRSVVASMRVASKSWGRYWASSRISTNCERWISDVSNGRQISSITDNYQEVTFEELIANGPEALTRIFCGLGVPSSLHDCRRYIDECNIQSLKAGKLENAPFPVANTARIGTTDSWRVELSALEIAMLEHLVSPLISELGFKPVIASRSLSALAAMCCTVAGAARWAKWRLIQQMTQRC